MRMRCCLLALSFLFVSSCLCGEQKLVDVPELGIRIAPGFRVSLFSDETLANDIYAMTLNSRGEVVVTSKGWIKTLHDSKKTGKADSATVFAVTGTGGMGMCFDGNDLLFVGDGFLSRYRDADGDGKADGPPEKILALPFGEHGGHTIRKGPDGWWYVIGGNETRFDPKLITGPNSPVKSPRWGLILRISPDFKQTEVFACGFRNPYRFDFNSAGDIFLYDSDGEREFLLPWYAPTRIYHVAEGMHHGWHTPGHMRNYCAMDYYADNVNILAKIGRGSPTGVCCYRHDAFPKRYRDGLFALDWTFGKVYFLPLTPDGASYKTEPEVFIEPIGSDGFAPTDACVAPDGSLLISIGGRRTRGAVFKIQFPFAGDILAPINGGRKIDPLEWSIALNIDQPFDSRSRTVWESSARKIGPDAFSRAAVTENSDTPQRVRAIEILTDLFDGLTAETARTIALTRSPVVRARAAWSLGRKSYDKELLCNLALDDLPLVRRNALESLARNPVDNLIPKNSAVLKANFSHDDKRVRLAAVRIATQLSKEKWDDLAGEVYANCDTQGQLSFALSELWRDPKAATTKFGSRMVALLSAANTPSLRLQAVRLIMLAYGDWNIAKPEPEFLAAYSLTKKIEPSEAKEIADAIHPLFPSGDRLLDIELSRMLAMIEDVDPATVSKIARMWSAASDPSDDAHYLFVLARLRGAGPGGMDAQIADAFLALDRKLDRLQNRSKQNWNVRLSEALGEYAKRVPSIAQELTKRPEIFHDGNIGFLAVLPLASRQTAARKLIELLNANQIPVCSAAHLAVLEALPRETVAPVMRRYWSNPGLRDSISTYLAKTPDETDREKYVQGLNSLNPELVNVSLEALAALKPDNRPEATAGLLQLLQRTFSQPQSDLRKRVGEFIARNTGEVVAFNAEKDVQKLKAHYEGIFKWFEAKYPELAKKISGDEDDDPQIWNATLKTVPWENGDAAKGLALAQTRNCTTCHQGVTPLGPDLSGVTNRFSKSDLFFSIVFPSRDVAPAYAATAIRTKSGQVHIGIPAFESADGVILRTGATTTVRIASQDTIDIQPSRTSVMPAGLLKGMTPPELADLYAYLRSLDAQKR